MDKRKVVLIGNIGRNGVQDVYDHYQRILRRRTPEVVGVYVCEAEDREILRELQASMEDPFFFEEVQAILLWRAELEFLCGGRHESIARLDELARSFWELVMAATEPNNSQPCIRWPQLVAPRKLGLKPTTASTAACRRKPRSSFFSASKTNLRNAP